MEEAKRNVQEMALAGLRVRRPDAGEEELFRRLMDLAFGSEFSERLHEPLRDGGR